MEETNEKKMSRRTAIKVGLAGLAGSIIGVNDLLGAENTSPYRRGETQDASEQHEQERPVKVLLINGSPRKEGNTFLALREAANVLEQQGLTTRIIQIGATPIRGCIACEQCHSKGLGRCVFDNDLCNRVVDELDDADAIIVGSPVYYGVPNGSVLSLLQRVFYSAGSKVQNKPAAAVCVCRRGGATAAYQTLLMPFQMMNMPVVTSQYWNIVYGTSEGEAALDAEGMQTMRTMAVNMAWILKKIHAGGNTDYPVHEPKTFTNFIR